jgi:hypothetical protein
MFHYAPLEDQISQVRIAVASAHATLATKRSLPLTWAGLHWLDRTLRLAHLFNQLIGKNDQLPRHGEAERLGGLHVDYKLEFSRPPNGEISRLFATQDAVDISRYSSVDINHIDAVRHYASLDGEGTELTNRRQAVALGQIENLSAVGRREAVPEKH